MRGPFRLGLAALAVMGLTACGDPNPDPHRGYIKAPLEQPGLVVRGEDVSEMSKLGAPIRPRAPQPDELIAEADDQDAVDDGT